MFLLTEDALLACDHGGRLSLSPALDWVRIDGRRVLVKPDPEGRSIGGCPNVNPFAGLKPCVKSSQVASGVSSFLRFGGLAAALDAVAGFTDGSPPGTVRYTVRLPGQVLVEAAD